MNPLTLVEAMTTGRFLTGLGLGIVVAVVGLIHRNGTALLASIGVAVAAGLWIEGSLIEAERPSTVLILLGAVWVGVASLGMQTVARSMRPSTLASLLALWVLGVWGTVPDTESALVLLGVVPVACLVIPLVSPPNVVGAFVTSIAILVVVAIDGVGRSSAPVGALGAAGVLMVATIAKRWLVHMRDGVIVVMQVAIVIWAGRIAGTADSAVSAAILLAVGFTLLGLTAVVARKVGARRTPPTVSSDR